MPRICVPDFSDVGNDQGWTCRVWASAEVFGQPVPLRVTRWRLDADSQADGIPLGGTEAMAYVIAGAGTAVAAPRVDGERFALARESVLWLAACPSLTLRAGPAGLDVLVAESAAGETAPAPLRKVLTADELPHLESTRDTRDRLDLVTDDVPVGATLIRADRIIYHPGDTAAAHYHTDCHHVFCVLAGSGLLYSGDMAHRLNVGDAALVGPGEVHWFENDRADEFSFVEFWAPPPTGTVWTVAGDRCTWAPGPLTAAVLTVDERLEIMYRRFTWRILSNYVTPWEFEQLKSQLTSYGQWCQAWSRHAAGHVARGDEALAGGRRRTAGDAYLRGALAYHWASFVFTHDQPQFQAALTALADAFGQAAPLVTPPAELLAVPFQGLTLPGYLRLPAGVRRPPLVVLLPGADSGKEELYNLADHIVARGLAAAAFDGPGQGPVSFHSNLRPDQEVAVQAMLDALAARPDIDTSRIAVGGISYGGLFAIRTAAVDNRVRAVFSMSSWYSPKGRFETMDALTRPGQYQHHGPDPAANMAAITLAGMAERATAPLLQVYGGNDPGSPPEHAERIAAQYGGPVTTVVYPDGVHILNNIWHIARPLVADWLAETLR